MASLAQWVEGARPRTLSAALAPVILGTTAAALGGRPVYGYAILALVVAVALQVGVNYANDYSDGIRGTDAERVGPIRLVGQRLARAESVKIAAFLCFGLAGLAGLALVALSETWLLLLVGAACIVAAWYYTGGSHPYGYHGLGEVMVFVFFGLVATLGTQYTQLGTVTWWGLAAGVGVGFIAMAILVANNLRDLVGDAAAGKRTLATRLGDRRTRLLWVGLIGGSVLCLALMGLILGPLWSLLGLLALPLVASPLRTVVRGATGRELIPALTGTGLYQIGYAVAIALGIFVNQLLA